MVEKISNENELKLLSVYMHASRERERERQRETERERITSLLRKSPPVIMAMLLNESDEPQVLRRAPRAPFHLTLITTRCSSFSHE
jgi:hypothetical protein